jgi:hypothetical protein
MKQIQKANPDELPKLHAYCCVLQDDRGYSQKLETQTQTQ